MASKIQDGEEVASWRYNAKGRLVETHSYLNRTKYNYDDAGRLVEQRSSWDGTQDGTTMYEYDDAGRLTKVTSDLARNAEIWEYEFKYDDADRLIWTRIVTGGHPNDAHRAAYDESGRLVKRDTLTYEYRSVGPNEMEMTTLRNGEALHLRRYRRLSGPAILPPTMPSFEDVAEELVALPDFPEPGPLSR